MSPGRKKPHCHTCGSPMAGHKRQNGLIICPAAAVTDSWTDLGAGDGASVNLGSTQPPPPQSPSPLSHSRLRTPQITEAQVKELEDIMPTSGFWHRRNPNWTDPSIIPPSQLGYEVVHHHHHRNKSPTASSMTSNGRTHSVVSTEPAGSNIFGGEKLDNDGFESESDASGSAILSTDDEEEADEDDKASVSSFRSTSSIGSVSSVLHQVLASSEPLASLFAMPTSEIPRVRCAADRHGLHVGLVRRPFGGGCSRHGDDDTDDIDVDDNKGKKTKGKGLTRSPSWWVVMGQNALAVKHLLDIHQRGPQAISMPGTLANTEDSSTMTVMMKTSTTQKHAPRRARSSGFMGFAIQLVLAGLIGGMVVLYGLSFL